MRAWFGLEGLEMGSKEREAWSSSSGSCCGLSCCDGDEGCVGGWRRLEKEMRKLHCEGSLECWGPHDETGTGTMEFADCV